MNWLVVHFKVMIFKRYVFHHFYLFWLDHCIIHQNFYFNPKKPDGREFYPSVRRLPAIYEWGKFCNIKTLWIFCPNLSLGGIKCWKKMIKTFDLVWIFIIEFCRGLWQSGIERSTVGFKMGPKEYSSFWRRPISGN